MAVVTLLYIPVIILKKKTGANWNKKNRGHDTYWYSELIKNWVA